MAGMGPPPKDAASRRRRNATVAMTRLPAEGRAGAPPLWPLPPDVKSAATLQVLRDDQANVLGRLDIGDERPGPLRAKLASLSKRIAMLEAEQQVTEQLQDQLWRDLWSTPQANAWERLRWTREVAQYVRWKVKAELGDLDAGKEARQLADRLGLNPLALLRLRWEISSDEVGDRRTDLEVPVAGGAARERLRVVDPGA